MQAIERAITRARYASHLGGSTPEAALEQFYAAFNGCADGGRVGQALASSLTRIDDEK